MEVANLNKKAINLLVSIGSLNISNKAVKDFEIERNFSDVSNKFTLTILDTPQLGLYDLELYMIAGNRSISVSYNDTADKESFVSFKGQIWDYTSSFVGNIKELTVTGYMSRAATYDTSGQALYNIDFNSYYNMRVDTKLRWNVNYLQMLHQSYYQEWLDRNTASYDDPSEYTVYTSDIVYSDFRQTYNSNSLTARIYGPGGYIDLPIPDSFTQAEEEVTDEETGDVIYTGDLMDPNKKFWGELHLFPSSYSEKCWADDDANIRAFQSTNDSNIYIQMNPEKQYFGAGSFIYNNFGVDPSYIVKQLCKLEGWKYTDTSIVQTELVPCSDAFKMQNQSALQFINDVLIPVSITPLGDYTLKVDKDGDGKKDTYTMDQPVGGFVAWFDSNNVFHYEPLSNLYKYDKRNILLGYNVKNSPVISFQVDTKGTCFYTTNNQVINAISLVTGKEIEEVATSTSQQILEYNKVKGHNEALDEFFGFTYEQIQELYASDSIDTSYTFWAGFGEDAKVLVDGVPTSIDDLYTPPTDAETESIKTYWGDNQRFMPIVTTTATVISSLIQDRLVTSVPSSGVTNEKTMAAQLADARSQVEKFMITASMSLWGDPRITPASMIKVTNLIKSSYTELHPTSGDYLVLKQTDTISSDTFTQKLSLIRANANLTANINPQNIDYSVKVQEASQKTSKEEAEIALDKETQWAEDQKGKVSSVVGLWDIYWERAMANGVETGIPDLSFSYPLPEPGDFNLIAPEISDVFKGINNAPILSGTSADKVMDVNFSLYPGLKEWYETALTQYRNGTLGDTKITSVPMYSKTSEPPEKEPYLPPHLNYYKENTTNSSNQQQSDYMEDYYNRVIKGTR